MIGKYPLRKGGLRENNRKIEEAFQQKIIGKCYTAPSHLFFPMEILVRKPLKSL